MPSSPSTSSAGSSAAQDEEEPYVFDAAAAAAKAKEKGKAVLSQPEIRPVCSSFLVTLYASACRWLASVISPTGTQNCCCGPSLAE